jgi:hypothetical protein
MRSQRLQASGLCGKNWIRKAGAFASAFFVTQKDYCHRIRRPHLGKVDPESTYQEFSAI